MFSYFDTGNLPSREKPERFYHGFVLGLIVDLLGRFAITSNRESSLRRYDVMLEPKDKKHDPGILLEFKVYDPDEDKKAEDTVHNALKQIEKKQCAASLIASGVLADHIRTYGVAFQGKRVQIGKGHPSSEN